MKFMRMSLGCCPELLQELFDNCVSEWHAGDSDEELHGYLGLSLIQYKDVIEGNKSVDAIVDEYRSTLNQERMRLNLMELMR